VLFGFGSNRSLDGSPAGQFNDTIYERLKLGTFVYRSQQVLSPQNARSIDRLGITIPASADFKNLFDSIFMLALPICPFAKAGREYNPLANLLNRTQYPT